MPTPTPQPGYGPIEHEAAASTAAVSATAHQVLWYSGNVAVGFFSSILRRLDRVDAGGVGERR